jgi:hypothetical protein
LIFPQRKKLPKKLMKLLTLTLKFVFTNLLMASHYIEVLFDQYCSQCLPSKTDKQLTSQSFHCCSCCSSARALLKDSLMENNNCFEWHVLLIFHLNSYRSFALPHVPSWVVVLLLFHCCLYGWFNDTFHSLVK